MAKLVLDASTRCDITYRKNDTFRFTITAKDASSNDFNFTGYTSKMQIKDALSGSVLQTYADGSGLTLETGLITVDLGKLALSRQELIYDLQLTSAGGDVSTWLNGKLIEVEDVTT